MAKSNRRVYPERQYEKEAGAMISEDRSQIANLPQEVKMTYWPKYPSPFVGDYNDSMSGIDNSLNEDGRRVRANQGMRKA